MKSLNRKEFLRLTSWGLIATLVPVAEVKALSFILDAKSNKSSDFDIAVELAKEAKVLFYMRDYAAAKDKYLACIRLAPAAIRFYDNLDNVYGAMGDWLASVELYKNGLLANPGIISFYDRAAISLMRLETGYKNKAGEYKTKIASSSLLSDAEVLYSQAIAIDPKPYLVKGLAKVKKKIEEGATVNDYRTDAHARAERLLNRNNHRARYRKFSIKELEERFLKVDNISRTTLYHPADIQNRVKSIAKEKKLILRNIVLKAKANTDYAGALDAAKRLYEIDKADTLSFRLYKRELLNNKNFITLISIYEELIGQKEGFYERLGYISTLQKAYEHGQVGIIAIDRSIEIAHEILKHWVLLEEHEIAMYDTIAKSYLLKGDFSTPKSMHESYLGVIKTSSAGLLFRFIQSYAKVCYAEKDFTTCKGVLMVALEMDDAPSTGYEKISTICQRANERPYNCIKHLYYLLYQVCVQVNDTDKAKEIVAIIRQYNPDDTFVFNK
jgi:tetratricopeptide (TPR) repeat protein